MKRILTYILLLTTLFSCSITRYVPENGQLYTGTKEIEFVDAEKYASDKTGETAMEEVKYALACPPNGALAGSSK